MNKTLTSNDDFMNTNQATLGNSQGSNQFPKI
jgi:hypothetical protein